MEFAGAVEGSFYGQVAKCAGTQENYGDTGRDDWRHGCPFVCGARIGTGAPKYLVDASWPRELPNHWIMGQVGGMAVDRHDHIWVLQRPGSDTPDELGASLTPQRSQCCVAAPPVLEFDAQGNLLQSWGGSGEGFDWPKTEHGIYVDKEDNVWLGGNAPTDRHLLKFRSDGHFLKQIGHPSADPPNSLRTDILGRPAGMEVDAGAQSYTLQTVT